MAPRQAAKKTSAPAADSDDFEIRFLLDGKTYGVARSKVTHRQDLALYNATGMGFVKLIDAIMTGNTAPFTIAGLVFLANLQSGMEKPPSYDEIADSIDFITPFDWQKIGDIIDLTDDAIELESPPEAQGSD